MLDEFAQRPIATQNVFVVLELIEQFSQRLFKFEFLDPGAFVIKVDQLGLLRRGKGEYIFGFGLQPNGFDSPIYFYLDFALKKFNLRIRFVGIEFLRLPNV